jgi:ribosomal protein S18 acetylase RimI-like enzyme
MIRTGQLNDFASIDSFDPFAGDRKAELRNGHCIVATHNHKVVAYVTFCPNGFIGRPFVPFLAVAPAYRRRGIATRLLAAVEKVVGSGRIFISTEETNQEMQLLLRKLNWTAAGAVRGVNEDGSAELFYFREV